MSFIIGTTLAILFLEWPWRALAIIGLGAIEVFEIWLWLKLRKMRSITGAEGMVGSKGRVVEDCDPDGRVSVKGALWNAHCTEGIEAGGEVVVTAVEGLRLEVKRRNRAPVGSTSSVRPEAARETPDPDRYPPAQGR